MTANGNGKLPETQSVAEWAAYYAELGYKIFPLNSVASDGSCTCRKPACDNVGKHPRTKGGLLDATNDLDTIRDWWSKWPDANIGCATGAVNGFFVLDGDGPMGIGILETMGVPASMIVTTGRPEGGKHFWLKHPDYHIKTTVKVLAGVDVRGDGGYVILPPSKHASGRLYSWERFDGLEECPANILKLLDSGRKSEERAKANTFKLDQKIGEGGRNSFLTSWAGKLRRGGADYDEIYPSVWQVNLKRCDPPLSEDEVRRIVDSVCKYEPSDPVQASVENISYPNALTDPFILATLTDPSSTDAANVKRLAALYGDKLRYDATSGVWALWNGQHWEKDTTGFIRRAILDVARTTRLAALSIKDSDQQLKVMEIALKLEQVNKQNPLITLAQSSDPFVTTVEQYDRDPLLAVVKNGTLDLRSGTLRESNRDDLITKSLGTHYDPDADCPRFKRFLSEVFEGNTRVIEYVQRAIGYSLTGETREQVLFVLYGNGSNGKSELNKVLIKLLGDYGTATDFSTFEVKKGDIGDDLASLRGARFVSSSEREDERILAEGRVKMVTGEDLVRCRFLYGNSFTYRPAYKIWLLVNILPVIRGTDDGIWRRLQIIPFKVKFEGEDKDDTIEEQLAMELSGILNWALDGLRDWQAQGLNPPPEVLEYVSKYRKEQDIILQWIDENCVIDRFSEDHAQIAALYENFKEWAFTNGFQRLSRNSFGRRMTEKGFERKHDSKGYMCYLGIRLKEPMEIFTSDIVGID